MPAATPAAAPSANHQLLLEVVARDDVLESLLKTTRHRGYRLREFSARQAPQSDRLAVTLAVDGEHPVSLLVPQLVKLSDVLSVEIGRRLD